MDYDLAVIGAGIQGAAVCQAASAAGYRVVLLEQYAEPAKATSSKSSKLIHGGLRYLESAQFALVRECLVERARLLRNAPHLVRLVPFHIPVYRTTQRRPWKIGVGLGLYSLLGGGRFSRLPKSRWDSLDGLRTEGLQQVFRYYDAQTDDARLTRSVIASARDLGADIRYSCRFMRAACTDDICHVHIEHNGNENVVSCAALVNAGGAWVNEIAARITPAPAAIDVDLVQGTHIEIAARLQRGIYYLEAPQDGRAVFAMPWNSRVLLGTTETAYRGDPALVKPLPTEVDYLLDVYAAYFNDAVEHADVLDSFAGLRVLPGGSGTAFNRSRQVTIARNERANARVLSIVGGKLTAWRLTGEHTVRALRPLLGQRRARADTRTLRLPEVD